MTRTVLFSPFIAFIVVFCNVIETRNQNDLDCLGRFVTSIQTASDSSEAALRIYRLFQVLHNVAVRYVELHVSQPTENQIQDSDEMDTYLAALGMPPLAEQNDGNQRRYFTGLPQGADGHQPGMDTTGVSHNREPGFLHPMLLTGNEFELEHWFYSNQAMMGLMEQSNEEFLSRD